MFLQHTNHLIVKALDELPYLSRCQHGDDMIVWSTEATDQYSTETRTMVFNSPIDNTLQISVRCYFGYIVTKSISLNVLSQITETLNHLSFSLALKVVPMPYEQKWLLSVAYETNEAYIQASTIPTVLNQAEFAAIELIQQMSEKIDGACFRPLNFGLAKARVG